MLVEPFGAKQTGSSHLISGKPCEDNFEIGLTEDGNWQILVVCDGAGSARKAAEGSKFISKNIFDCLVRIGNELNSRAAGAWINDEIISAIVNIRSKLRKISQNDDLSDYHTTIVGALIGPHGGLSLHIGDGIIIGGKTRLDDEGRLILNDKFYYSEPENGEYANETFFITEKDWIKHLRIRTFPRLDWLIVASDGGGSFLQSNSITFKSDIIEDIFNRLSFSEVKNSFFVLDGLMSDPIYEDLTSDDKTILMTVDESIYLNNFQKFVFKLQEGSKNSISVGDSKNLDAEQVMSNKRFDLNILYEFSKRNIVFLISFFLIFVFIVFSLISIVYLFANTSSIPMNINVSKENLSNSNNLNYHYIERYK